jgi:carboxypeptidase D
MLFKSLITTGAFLLASTQQAAASLGSKFHIDNTVPKYQHAKRTYFPKPAEGLKEFTTPTGVKIRYKVCTDQFSPLGSKTRTDHTTLQEPGKEGICETTPGVNSYSGYIDIAPNVHTFFWFFESRSNPAEDPLTLWLNGGPGSDSLIGLFQELGPCRINPDLKSQINPYSWNEVSNMLFLSQPVGTGFSYQEEEKGSFVGYSGLFQNASQHKPTGIYPLVDPINVGTIDTTDLAAVAAWHILQGFLSGLPTLAGNVDVSRDFNLWTESYGGHYGPAFFNYFQEQNTKITSGECAGYKVNFATLGIGNGIIDEAIQAEWYPEFAVNNTYGIKAYNDTVYEYARFATFWPNGCYAQIESCKGAAQIKGGYKKLAHGHVITTHAAEQQQIDVVCQEAADMCRDNVEYPYYIFSGRGTYDIRHPANDPTPPEYFTEYLNLAEVQNALGVSANYTESNNAIYFAFQSTGDFIYPNFLADLENILASGVRVSLFYGDADYICNWFGGQAVSLALKYAHSKEFAAAGYQPFTWGGVEYGEVREYGNFSFTRIYEAGHEVPYYQRKHNVPLH